MIILPVLESEVIPLQIYFRSYSNAAFSTTSTEPTLCTSAPLIGLSSARMDRIIATKFMPMDRLILNLISFTVAFDKRFR